jgi:hydrogenase maturation protease
VNTLVVGLGNTLLGDEGVGVHIVNILKDQPLPQSVVLKDGGVSGFDILPDILESDRVVIIDAAKMGLVPGSVRSFTLDNVQMPDSPEFSLHDLGLPQVLKLGSTISSLPPMLLIGIEPKKIAPGASLSEEVTGQMENILEYVYSAILDFTKEVVN